MWQNRSTFNKPKTKCCACKNFYHLSCAGIPKNSTTSLSSWICLSCKPTIFPFHNLDKNKITELSNHKAEKFSRKNISCVGYADECTICNIKLKNSNPGVPCSSCHSKIHVKCSSVFPWTSTFITKHVQ